MMRKKLIIAVLLPILMTIACLSIVFLAQSRDWAQPTTPTPVVPPVIVVPAATSQYAVTPTEDQVAPLFATHAAVETQFAATSAALLPQSQ